jgi:hypothetical protein
MSGSGALNNKIDPMGHLNMKEETLRGTTNPMRQHDGRDTAFTSAQSSSKKNKKHPRQPGEESAQVAHRKAKKKVNYNSSVSQV